MTTRVPRRRAPVGLVVVAWWAVVLLAVSACASDPSPGGRNLSTAKKVRMEMDATTEKIIEATAKALDGEVSGASGTWTECNLPGTGYVAYQVGGSLVAPSIPTAERIDRLTTSLGGVGIDVERDQATQVLRADRPGYRILVNEGVDRDGTTTLTFTVAGDCVLVGRDAASGLTDEPQKTLRGSGQ